MTLSTDANITDADLINLSRSGDRKAFGQIVRRYQALVSGLAYAACGDLHRSEDVAQETFVSAWKSLSGLRDATKLPGWLCQIARRRLADVSRKASSTEIQFSQAFASGQEPAAPADEAATAEECELLWRTLSGIPQPYRETLVLYYRQEKSTAQVAAAMETTEAAVRQNLARGRQMLRDEIAAVMERNLARTAPRPQFALQVVAVLPAIGAQTAGIGVTAKGASAVAGSGIISFLVSCVAPIGFFFALIFGTIQDVRQAQTPRLKRLAKRQGIVMWLVIIAALVELNCVLPLARKFNWDLATVTLAFSIAGMVFGMALFSVVTFGRWQTERVLREEGITEPPFPNLAIWQRLCFTLPVAALCVGFMVRFAIVAGDRMSVDIIAASIVGIGLFAARRLPKLQPQSPIQQTFENFTLALVVIGIMLNWRLQEWMATAKGMDLEQKKTILPMWSINTAIAVLFAWTAVLTAMSRGQNGDRTLHDNYKPTERAANPG
jgi:RNA polymerase sigma factor (sigma-70 family)